MYSITSESARHLDILKLIVALDRYGRNPQPTLPHGTAGDGHQTARCGSTLRAVRIRNAPGVCPVR